MTLPSTKDRVPAHTPNEVNGRIRADMERRVHALAANRSSIGARLRELDEEWDVERAIEANASSIAFVGVALGYLAHPYWLALPALVTAFLFQHAIQGWCPPIPVLRRLGFRTANEIDTERQALKALRGDFENAASSANAAIAAVERQHA